MQVTNVIKLQRKGGIGILDIHHYYIAYNSRYTPSWACNEKEYERNGHEEKTSKEYNIDFPISFLM